MSGHELTYGSSLCFAAGFETAVDSNSHLVLLHDGRARCDLCNKLFASRPRLQLINRVVGSCVLRTEARLSLTFSLTFKYFVGRKIVANILVLAKIYFI